MGVAERKQREKEKRIKSIKRCALKLFAKKGHENVTMAEIAEEAEIAKGTIYLFFKSKSELLYSLLEPVLESHYQKTAVVMQNSKEKADIVLRRYFEVSMKHYLNEPEAYQVIMYYKAEEMDRLFTPEKLNNLKMLMTKTRNLIEGLLLQGIDQKVFKAVNARATAIFIYVTIIGILQFGENRRYSRGKDYIKPNMDNACELIIKGLKA